MPSPYDAYLQAIENRPADAADPSSFYTPELQKAFLDQLIQGSNDSLAQNRATISGQGIVSGFGVGNTSRDATRRAKADSQAMNEIVQGAVNQAAEVEAMRVAQIEEAKQRRFNQDQSKLNQEQRFKLAQQGYDTTVAENATSRAEAARAGRQDLLVGGLQGIASSIPSFFSPSSGNPSPSYKSVDLSPKLSLYSQPYTRVTRTRDLSMFQ